MKINKDIDFGFEKHFLRDVFGEGDTGSVNTDRNDAGFRFEREFHLIHVNIRTAVANRAEHPAPVRVSAKHGGFDERRSNHGFRGDPGILIGLRAAHPAFEHLGRAFAVPGDHAAEMDRDGVECFHESRKVRALGSDRLISGKTVREQQHVIIRRRVTVHGRHIEGLLHIVR